MALLYGSFSLTANNNDDLSDSLARHLKWPAAEEHKFSFHKLSGGLVLNSDFKTDLSEYVYFNESRQTLVVVSGHIYNLAELNSKFKPQGKSAAEIVYNLFFDEGERFVQKLNGDFIIVIYNKDKARLLIYRDHLGIRPLTYILKKESFCFSSNGVELCRVLNGSSRINKKFIYKYFKNSDISNVNVLPLKAARKLDPGSYLSVSAELNVSEKKFWFPERIKEDRYLKFDQAKNELRSLLIDSVRIRSNPNLTAGTHLSGGLDSGIVGALAKQNYSHQDMFYGFSWSSDDMVITDEYFDERKLVLDAGKHCGIEPQFINFDHNDFLNIYNSSWYFKDFFHEAILRKEAKKKNIQILFSGWGGDEFIGINSRGVDSDLIFKFKWKKLFKKYSALPPNHIIKRILLNVIFPALGLMYPFDNNKSIRFYNYLLNSKKFMKSDNLNLYKWKSRRDVHLNLLRFGHLSERTEFWFLNGYREGIEYRYPLLDKRIIEYVLRIPSNQLATKKWARIMLREICDEFLPSSVTWAVDKSNPVVYRKMQSIAPQVLNSLIGELQDYKSNPDLNFINFRLLEIDIKKLKQNDSEKDLESILDLLFVLKQINEFTKGYYNN